MKTAAARVFAVSERRRAAGGRPIGQLIFDPQGEYANPNTQDGTEFAAIGINHVVIYKFGGGQGSERNVRALGVNFFDPAQIDAVKAMIAGALADASADCVPRDERFRTHPSDVASQVSTRELSINFSVERAHVTAIIVTHSRLAS